MRKDTPMYIGVLADTHDNMFMIRQAGRLFSRRGVEMIIHAGDFIAPFALKAILEPGMPLVGVFGNNDGEKVGLRKTCETIYEPPHRFELEGRTVVLTHDAKDLSEELACNADLVICGHTHRAQIEEGPPLRLNPGEAGGWLYDEPTVALVDLDAMKAEILRLTAEKGR